MINCSIIRLVYLLVFFFFLRGTLFSSFGLLVSIYESDLTLDPREPARPPSVTAHGSPSDRPVLYHLPPHSLLSSACPFDTILPSEFQA